MKKFIKNIEFVRALSDLFSNLIKNNFSNSFTLLRDDHSKKELQYQYVTVRNLFGIAAVLATLSISPVFAGSNQNISANNPIDLLSHTSQYSRVSGIVTNTEVSDNSRVIFLNFGKNFGTAFSAVIYDNAVPSFVMAGITEPSEFYANKTVEVEGIIRRSNGKPEIVVDSPDQIKIVN